MRFSEGGCGVGSPLRARSVGAAVATSDRGSAERQVCDRPAPQNRLAKASSIPPLT
jgi:hypothetical protein